MLSLHGPEIIGSCRNCTIAAECLFSDLSPEASQQFEKIKVQIAYPKGAGLFAEGDTPSGIFVLCKGRVKMSVCASDGKTLIVKMSEPGEVLGLGAVLSGKPYELTAQTTEPSQVNFVKRHDFLRFIKDHSDACFKVTLLLSENYRIACHEVRTLGLLRTADQRLANLLLQWSYENGEGGKAEDRLEVKLTQEAIGQVIGTSRETVIRALADFKKRQIIGGKGSTLFILDRPGLAEMAAVRGAPIDIDGHLPPKNEFKIKNQQSGMFSENPSYKESAAPKIPVCGVATPTAANGKRLRLHAAT